MQTPIDTIKPCMQPSGIKGGGTNRSSLKAYAQGMMGNMDVATKTDASMTDKQSS